MKPPAHVNGHTAAPHALLGMLWWIDRWRLSQAFAEMTLEQQGAYRNLLDEAWLRHGVLPNDPKLLAKASGDPRRWKYIRPVVMRWFTRTRDGWRNRTLTEVREQSQRRADKQRAYRDRKRRKESKTPAHPRALPRALPRV